MAEQVVTLRDLIPRAAARHPHHEAAVDAVARYTYAALLDRVRRMARLLHAQGVRKGDRVALLMPPSTSHLVALFGAIELGAIPCALHARESAATLAAITGRLSPRALVYDGAYAAQALALLERQPLISATIRAVSALTPQEAAGTGPVIPADLEAHEPDYEPMPATAEETAVIALSSGTTGVPKGVMHSHRTLVASARCGAPYMAAHPDAASINIFSTAFIGWYNCTLPFLYGGSKIVYLSQWDPAEYLQAIQDERATVCFLVPTMWRMLLRAHPERYALSSLERVGYAGEAMDTATMARLREQVCGTLINTYGTTESGSWGGCTVMLPEDYADERRVESVGRAGAGVEIRVITPGGPVDGTVAPGEEGEVIISGPSVAGQLWEQPDLARRIFDGRWWRSGDMGVLDAEGYLYLKGRIDDMIITGGINVLPGEVEEAVLSHPAVSECVVIGLPSEQWGQQVTAFVISQGEVSAEELARHVATSPLSGYKKPREYRFVSELPRGNTGKVSRRLLRDQVLAAAGAARADAGPGAGEQARGAE